MKKKNIYLQYHYIPIYKFKIFKDKYIKKSNIYYSSAISLQYIMALVIHN